MISRRTLFKILIATPLTKLINQPKINYYLPKVYKDKLENLLYARIEKGPVTLISTREFRIPLTIRPGSSTMIDGKWYQEEKK